MIAAFPTIDELSPETQAYYRRVIQMLNEERVPFLVGGAYALAQHTGIVRHTKDFDIFVRRRHFDRALDLLAAAGYQTEVTFSHWLGKAFNGEDFVDVIFSAGNGIAKVDDVWFEHARTGTFLHEPVLVCPAEEMIWSKAFICERERFDGADINHLLRASGDRLDWQRLLGRFGPHWRVLLSHLTLFGFVYPSDRTQVPAWVMQELLGRLAAETQGPPPADRVCQGTLLSRIQYCIDLQLWGYRDARLEEASGMSEEQADVWTDAGLEQQAAAQK